MVDVRWAAKIDSAVPHPARIWDYWLGGKAHYPVDRAIGDGVASVYPEMMRSVRESRRFLVRVVRQLAGEAGIRQFLDVGAGLPTMRSTHQVAQEAASDAKVVYLDNDPLVRTHARSLLIDTTDEGVTVYLDSDMCEPGLLVRDACNVLNFERPIAVLFIGVLGHLAELDQARDIVTTVTAAVPSGSYLAVSDSTATGPRAMADAPGYVDAGVAPYYPRTAEQLNEFFAGLDLLEPGLVPLADWRPDVPADTGAPYVEAYGAVARKP